MDFSLQALNEEDKKTRSDSHKDSFAGNQKDALTDLVRQKLIESSSLDKIKDLMERRLIETGWKRHMMNQFRDYVDPRRGTDIRYDDLYTHLKKPGLDLISESVKQEIIQNIKYCYEEE